MNWATIAGPVIAAVVSLVGAFLAVRQARAAASAQVDVKRIEVDAAAFERARVIYESGIQQMEEQIRRLSAQMSQEQDASNRLRDQVRALEDLVAQLRRQLIMSGIDVAQAHELGR